MWLRSGVSDAGHRLGGVWLKRGLVRLEVALPTRAGTTGVAGTGDPGPNQQEGNRGSESERTNEHRNARRAG